ncbi:MAG: JAB domain-containing protein [Deltaproteobacteria bacterium]|nr:JAB domain-containing protein [Deltaproteobacteria bacterium]MBM4346716.1 JAB domain-containing protein [Deltaproteobacteria bacterium]
MSKDSSFTVRDLPRQERPRERLQKFGAEALSAQELLALVIGRGIPKKSVMNIAQELLAKFGNVKAINTATIEELSQIKGIGLAKAAQIKACFELGRREELEPELKDFDIKNPEAVVKALRASIRDKAKEHFKLILLNPRNRIIGISNISIGTLNASLVHPREVFKDAITHSAASVVLAHNHPSGDPDPSEDDLKITKKMVDSGKILGIEVLDHIVIGKNNFCSFKERGLI